MTRFKLIPITLFLVYFTYSCKDDNIKPDENDSSTFITIDGMRYINSLSILVDTTEVSVSQYNYVMNDSENVDSLLPKRLSYVDAILYCNKKSVEEGLDPVFSYDSIGVIKKTYLSDSSVTLENYAYNLTIDTTQNGYRLPTYEEYQVLSASNWESNTYESWENEIFYYNSDGQLLDVDDREPNDFGLYNLIGNIAEYTLWTVSMSDELYCEITDLEDNVLFSNWNEVDPFVLTQPLHYGVDASWNLEDDDLINDVLGDMTKVIYRCQYIKLGVSTIGTSYAGFRTVRKVKE